MLVVVRYSASAQSAWTDPIFQSRALERTLCPTNNPIYFKTQTADLNSSHLTCSNFCDATNDPLNPLNPDFQFHTWNSAPRPAPPSLLGIITHIFDCYFEMGHAFWVKMHAKESLKNSGKKKENVNSLF